MEPDKKQLIHHLPLPSLDTRFPMRDNGCVHKLGGCETMNKRWAYLYAECTTCHTTDKPHKGNGLCTTCYYRQYNRPNPPNRRSTLELFVRDLPLLLKDAGAVGYSVSYSNGTVTIKKLGTKLSATWPK